MTNYLKIDDNKKALVMDRTFAKNAQIVGSKEYDLLQSAKRDYPTYEVVRRQIKKKEQQEHYKGLTYEFMEDYILTHEPRATKNEVYDEFRELLEISRCHSRRYPIIKKWFLAQYPNIEEFGKKKDEENKENTLSVVETVATVEAEEKDVA